MRATAYVVSRDPDLKECCSEAGPLFYAASVRDVISQATVSKQLHDALETALCESDRLREELIDQIKDKYLVPVSVPFRGGQGRAEGKIDDVDEIYMSTVNVLDQEEQTFTCEIEFDTTLIVDLNIEIDWGYNGDYQKLTTHESIGQVFYAEVVARLAEARAGNATG
jgi:hypothetical protein